MSVEAATAKLEAVKRGIYHHIRSGMEVVCGTSRGLVEQWRGIDVTLYDCPDIRMGDIRWVFPEGKPEQSGFVVGCLTPQKPIIAIVHPDQWETARAAFHHLGITVTNGDAPFTPFR